MTIVLTILGVALPSLLVVAALRRWIVPVPWRFAALFLVMTFAFQHGAVFTSKLPVPVDEVARGFPYRGVVGDVNVRNPLTNDTVKLFLPWMQVAREELFHLRPPLWNRYSFSGYPLLANGESAPFSPLFLSTLFVPLPKQIVVMAGLKIFLSLLFGFLFCRRFGISEAASCFAATAFAWSVFETVFLYYSTTAVTSLLPAFLFALYFALEEGGKRGVVLVAVVMATLMANGHPESVLHIGVAAAGLMCIELALAPDRGAWLARFRLPLLGAALGLALSAPAWVPVLEQVLASTRLADLRRMGGHPAMYPLTAIWTMVSPNGFGNPVRQNWSWFSNYSSIAASYVGLVVLALAATGLVSRRTSRRDRSWLVFSILLWLVALSWSPVGSALNELPPFSITANDKLRFAALFIAAVAAARVLDAFRRPLFLAFGGVLAGLALYVHSAKALPLVDLAAVVAVAVVAITPRRAIAVIAFLCLAAELFLLNSGFNALVDARYYRPDLPIVDALRRAAPREPFRIAGFDWTFLPNASAQYGLEDVRGSDPMSFEAYTRVLGPLVVDDPTIDVDRVVNVDHALLDQLNVRFLVDEPGRERGGRWRLRYSGPDGTLFENATVLGRFYVSEGDATVRVLRSSPLRLELSVDARTPARIASSQPSPGWRLDGASPIEKGFFLGFSVPEGRSRVVLRYVPVSFYGSLPIALGAALLLAFRKSWNSPLQGGVVRGPDAVPGL